MSLSKLESLPNEILTDLIENYINGVDVLMAFNYQLNRRFDALIAQCHRLRFNFIQCRKDDFCFCMGLLSAYVDKIEELRLSEKDTPGQIYAFLSFFPSFTQFKRLHTLYFHFDGKAVSQRMVESALYSLSNTNITTLSIQMINMDDALSSGTGLIRLFQLKTLKRFSLVSNTIYMNWNSLSDMSSNIEYLSIPDKNFQLNHLQSILQWAPRLKYLDIGIVCERFAYYDNFKKNSKKTIIPTVGLHTLILSFSLQDSTTLDMLAPYFHSMPVLNRLEIIASNELVNANAWELLFETSLPLLKHFTLQTVISRSESVNIQNLRASFQNSFWLARQNFNIIITDYKSLDFNWSDSTVKQSLDVYDLNIPVIECSIAPVRAVNNGFSMVKDITKLRLSTTSDTVMCHHYFESVKCLTVDNMDKSLFKWMTTYVNCLRITELYITSSFTKIEELDILLTNVPYINSLHMNFSQLMHNKAVFVGKMNCLKCLNISISKHAFNEEYIYVIANLFPYLEHLQINTSDIHNVPLLETYLPHLRSLTVNISEDYPDYYNMYGRQRWDNELRNKNKFLFECKNNFLTIWIDKAAYREPYWEKYVKISPKSVTASTTTVKSDNNNKTKKWKFPFRKFFK